jgi:hypothetical protein
LKLGGTRELREFPDDKVELSIVYLTAVFRGNNLMRAR